MAKRPFSSVVAESTSSPLAVVTVTSTSGIGPLTLVCRVPTMRSPSALATPEGSDHGNIRALMVHGLAGVKFAQQPLTRR